MAKMKLEIMFGDVSECWEGHFDHIWRFSNLAGGHLGFFPKGLTYDFGQKFQISSKFMYGQHKAGKIFGDVSECWEGHFDHIWSFSVYELF